jgi:PadR family transcriptional regulator, regulatory protein AphA
MGGAGESARWRRYPRFADRERRPPRDAVGVGDSVAVLVEAELNRLAADGLTTVVEEGPRGRRTYAITDAGRIELRRWILDPNDQPVVRNEHILKLFLLSTLDIEDARKVLRQQVEGSRQEYERLRAAIDAATDTGQPPVALFAAELGARYFQTLHEWALWALDRLDPA